MYQAVQSAIYNLSYDHYSSSHQLLSRAEQGVAVNLPIAVRITLPAAKES